MFVCNLCGSKSKREQGLRTHLSRRHGISRRTHDEAEIVSCFTGTAEKKSRVGRPKKVPAHLELPAKKTSSSLTISVPCKLGENNFMVDVSLTIAGTAITPV